VQKDLADLLELLIQVVLVHWQGPQRSCDQLLQLVPECHRLQSYALVLCSGTVLQKLKELVADLILLHEEDLVVRTKSHEQRGELPREASFFTVFIFLRVLLPADFGERFSVSSHIHDQGFQELSVSLRNGLEGFINLHVLQRFRVL